MDGKWVEDGWWRRRGVVCSCVGCGGARLVCCAMRACAVPVRSPHVGALECVAARAADDEMTNGRTEMTEMTKMAEMTTEMTEMTEMAEMDGDHEWMDARRGAEGGKGRHWMVRRVERVRMCGELWMCGVALVCDVFRRMEGGCGLCVACARCELVILWTFERVSHSVVRRERVSTVKHLGGCVCSRGHV